ncbi:MAG TPA: 50S ribosomal protein L9 [Candidatus Paceibacterota bacterium]
MKIILLKNIPKIGRKYDTKDISDGYAINMLIPKGLAVAATADVVKRIELEKAREEGERKVRHELLLKNLNELEGVTIVMEEKANEKGHLFAGIHKPEIIKAIEKQTRLQVDGEHIVLDKPIKEIGTHAIIAKIENKSIEFNIEIKPIA